MDYVIFLCFIIIYCFTCTMMRCLQLLSKVLFLLCSSNLFVLYVSLCVNLPVSRWVMELPYIINN
jgi:hypothetical protein